MECQGTTSKPLKQIRFGVSNNSVFRCLIENIGLPKKFAWVFHKILWKNPNFKKKFILKLQDNYFTILCWFPPYISMNQPHVYICPYYPESRSHLPPHPTRPGPNKLFPSPKIFPVTQHCSDGKESAWNAGAPGSIPGSGRSPEEGHGNPLQYSCLENPMDRGAWWATVHGGCKVLDTIEWLTHTTL